MEPYVPDLKKKCHLSNDIYDYHFVSMGKTKVSSLKPNSPFTATANLLKPVTHCRCRVTKEDLVRNWFKRKSAVQE